MSFLAKADLLIAGRYRLRRPIGEGGMGGVWEATDQVLGCPIALKVVPEKHLTGDRTQQIQRFLREARLAAQVQHPSVVRVTDFGVHEDTPYIAMELLEGESLADRMYREPSLEIEEAVQICIGVLRGLGAAHEADVVHRDIKPENVQLVSTVEGLYPKLIDFGISLGTDQNKQRVSAVTTNGHVFGTPLYMSPEHARGLDIDGRADLYSLGVVLYEMVALQPPFEAENAADMMAAIVRDTAVEPCAIRPSVPKALSDAIMKVLSKEPDDRFATANEMARALAAAVPAASADVTGPVTLSSGVHRVSTESRAPTAAYSLPTTKRRSPALVLGLLVLSASVGLIVKIQAEPDPSVEAQVTRSADAAETSAAETEVVDEEGGASEPVVAMGEELGETAETGETTEPGEPAAPLAEPTSEPTRPERSAAEPSSRPVQPRNRTRMSFRQLDY